MSEANVSGLTLDAVTFDSTGHELKGDLRPGEVRVWYTPDGDGLGLYLFPIPPDLPANATSRDELVAFYVDQLAPAGGKLVELDLVAAAGMTVLRTIASLPGENDARVYVGAITLPFRDFSYVFKCQCDEEGVTGMKETLLRARALTQDVGTADPDDPAHDADYPAHPVARCRRALAHVASTLRIDDEVAKLPRFPLPPLTS